MPYEDGERTLFLYTKGKKGNPSEELKQLLRYMEHTTAKNAINEDLKAIQEMVETIKRDEEVSIELMKLFEQEEMWLNKGFAQGREAERANTERERENAVRERKRADAAEEEIRHLKEELRRLQEN